jgi:hypothetical protein
MNRDGDDLDMIGRFDMRKISTIALVVALFGIAGCASDPEVDIGDGRTGEQLRDYAAAWEGYAEAHTFSDGSDRVRLTLDEDGEGTLEIGDSPALTVDPDHPQAASDLVPGFAYTVRFAEVESKRLRFRFDPHESLAGWCAVQTPSLFFSDPEVWACLPNGTTSSAGKGNCFLTPDGEEERPVDCQAIYICGSGICACTEQSCAIPELSEEQALDYAVDGALEQGGNRLVGTLRLGSGSTANPIIRLERQ